MIECRFCKFASQNLQYCIRLKYIVHNKEMPKIIHDVYATDLDWINEDTGVIVQA